jgi:hypothetical protein
MSCVNVVNIKNENYFKKKSNRIFVKIGMTHVYIRFIF